jgi:hypothetical protein
MPPPWWSPAGAAEAAGGRRDAIDPDDPLHEDAGRDDRFRIELAEGDDPCTVAIVVFAAIAITGPKLRAVMR